MSFADPYGFPEDILMAQAPADLSFMSVIKEEINSPDDQLDASAFAAAQHRPPDRMDFDGAGALEPKKGKKRTAPEANSPPENNGKEKKNANGVVGLTELIDKIAAEKSALRFDDETKLYEVLDGPAFEARFQELRRTRSKRSNETATRPFSRMHVHYTIVRGERWAGTGTAFRAKDAVVDDFLDTEKVQASKINVTLMPSDGLAGFQVTLQHFLNVTGAGDAYKRAMRGKDGEQSTPSSDQSSPSPDAAQEDAPPVQRESSDDYWHSLSIDTVSEAVNSVWNENSKGDQAYFFYREDRNRPFANGSIVKLVNGKLRADNTPSERAVFMVVSDLNAKWKGEPIPTAEQEKLGHWVCFLGQVPVRVRGAVRSGEYVGPANDGSGCGVATTGAPGTAPVVGIALVGKEDAGEGIVRTMCFAGLNAMNAQVGDGLPKLLEEGLQTRREVEALRLDLSRTKKEVKEGMDTLNERVDHIERQLDISYAGYAVAGSGVALSPRMTSPRLAGGWVSPRDGSKSGRRGKIVGGKELELRIMGGCDEAGVPCDEDFIAGKWDEKGLYRAQCVSSPKAGCGGLDNQRKTRVFIVTALCVLFLGVVAAAFFIGWQSANDFATGEDPAAQTSTRPPVSSAPSSDVSGESDSGSSGSSGCNALTTMVECGSVVGCLWAEVESGEFAGLYACINAPDTPQSAPGATDDTDEAEEDEHEYEGGEDEDGEDGSQDGQGGLVPPPVGCEDMATEEACGAAADCEWADVEETGAWACLGSDVVDAARCGRLETEEECQAGVMCGWERGADGVMSCGVATTEMFMPDCEQLVEESECVDAGGCEWRLAADGAPIGCQEKPTCEHLTTAASCSEVAGCLWFSYGEKGNLCMLDPNADEVEP